jgi:alpha-L-rhamnosidase
LACEIKPAFVTALEDASAYHVTPAGKVTSAWKREGDEIVLTVEIPEGMSGRIALRDGYAFTGGEAAKPAVSGSYRVIRKK